MYNDSYLTPNTSRNEVVQFAVWILGIKFRKCVEFTDICMQVASHVLNGQFEDVLDKEIGKLGHRIQARVTAHIDFLKIMSPETHDTVTEESIKFARWFMDISVDENEIDIRKQIIALLLNGQIQQAMRVVSGLGCSETREQVENYLRILESL
jgi:hypothetical protein